MDTLITALDNLVRFATTFAAVFLGLALLAGAVNGVITLVLSRRPPHRDYSESTCEDPWVYCDGCRKPTTRWFIEVTAFPGTDLRVCPECMGAEQMGRNFEDRAYRKQKARFRRECAALGRPCWLCGGAIDYSLAWPHPDSWSLDHIQPAAQYPELARVWSNFASTHLACNRQRQTSEPTGLGDTSGMWG